MGHVLMGATRELGRANGLLEAGQKMGVLTINKSPGTGRDTPAYPVSQSRRDTNERGVQGIGRRAKAKDPEMGCWQS
jgi:hypothetical protein